MDKNLKNTEMTGQGVCPKYVWIVTDIDQLMTLLISTDTISSLHILED